MTIFNIRQFNIHSFFLKKACFSLILMGVWEFQIDFSRGSGAAIHFIFFSPGVRVGPPTEGPTVSIYECNSPSPNIFRNIEILESTSKNQ